MLVYLDDVAIWDNRATMHYAVRDYGDQPRVVRRVAIDSEAPVALTAGAVWRVQDHQAAARECRLARSQI